MKLLLVLLLFPLPLVAQANSIYSPPGANLTLGNTSHNNGFSVIANNPAATSALTFEHDGRGLGINIGGGLEYGNVDEIFELIDAISEIIGSDGEDVPERPPPVLPDEPVQLPENVTWKDILENSPKFQGWYQAVQAQAAFLASSIAIISQEAYAKAFWVADIPLLVTDNKWGGSLSLSYSKSSTSKAMGIVDAFDFDAVQALEQIEAARSLSPDAPQTIFELSDDVLLVVDPGAQTVDLKFNNDSLLLTKAAKIQNFSLNYSRAAMQTEAGTLWWGVRPKLYRVGLTQVDTRFGELSDAEALFDDIKNAEYHNSSRLSADLGLLWSSEYYRLGVTVMDPLKPEFSFPGFDPSRYSKQLVLKQLRREMRYTLDSQVRFEGSLFTPNKLWSTHLQIDANPVTDPMNDEYQWMVLSTAYRNKNNWVPDLRFGVRKNLSGTGLIYLSGGVTVFKLLNLDIASTDETATIDGKTLPRGINFSLGLNIAF